MKRTNTLKTALFFVFALSIILFSCKNGTTDEIIILTPLSFFGDDEDGKKVEIVITRPSNNKAVLTPANNDKYSIKVDSVIESSGTIAISGETWTFTPTDTTETPFTGTLENMILSIPSIPGKTTSNILSTNIGGTKWVGTFIDEGTTTTGTLTLFTSSTFSYSVFSTYMGQISYAPYTFTGTYEIIRDTPDYIKLTISGGGGYLTDGTKGVVIINGNTLEALGGTFYKK